MSALSALRLALMAITIAALCLTLRIWSAPLFSLPILASAAVRPLASGQGGRAPTVDSVARAISSRNPFRADRRPSSVPFDPARQEGAPQATRPTRPSLSVAGVVLGSSPAAIIEGLPGVEGGRLLGVGERVGDFVLREVSQDRVIVSARDTTWSLRVKGRSP